MTSSAPALKDRLRQIATGGVASIAFNVAATNVLRIFSSMTLTRLLDSTAYGVVGVITSVAYMLTMLSDVGIYDFLVRHHEGDERNFLDQVWTIRLIRGVLLAVVMVLIAKPATIFLDKPELAPVVAVWGLNFILDGLSSLAFATAVRQQKLWRLSNLDLSANVVTLVVSIIFAAVTHSYWAMIAGMLAGGALKLFLSYLLFPNRGGAGISIRRDRKNCGAFRAISRCRACFRWRSCSPTRSCWRGSCRCRPMASMRSRSRWRQRLAGWPGLTRSGCCCRSIRRPRARTGRRYGGSSMRDGARSRLLTCAASGSCWARPP